MYVPTHTYALAHSCAPLGGSNPRGLCQDVVLYKQERRQVVSDAQSVPVFNDGRRAAPGTSRKSCDLNEPQGLSPKTVWDGDE